MSEHTNQGSEHHQHTHGAQHDPSKDIVQQAQEDLGHKTQAPMLTVDREFKFSFKKQTVVDDLGKEVKRPPIMVTVPVTTFDGLLEAFDNPKVRQFVLDLVEESIKDQVRAQLSDEEKPVMRQSELDLAKLSLVAIAELPKSERTGGGIPKELWTDWEADYTSTMLEVRKDDPKAADRIGRAVKLFTGRFNGCRGDKPVIKFLLEQLGIWATNSQNVEDFADIFNYLDTRGTDLMTKDSASILANL